MGPKKRVDLWYCNSCSVVHLAIGKTHVSFDRSEFEQFTSMVVETNYTGWPAGGPVQIDDRTALADGVFCSSAVH